MAAVHWVAHVTDWRVGAIAASSAARQVGGSTAVAVETVAAARAAAWAEVRTVVPTAGGPVERRVGAMQLVAGVGLQVVQPVVTMAATAVVGSAGAQIAVGLAVGLAAGQAVILVAHLVATAAATAECAVATVALGVHGVEGAVDWRAGGMAASSAAGQVGGAAAVAVATVAEAKVAEVRVVVLTAVWQLERVAAAMQVVAAAGLADASQAVAMAAARLAAEKVVARAAVCWVAGLEADLAMDAAVGGGLTTAAVA